MDITIGQLRAAVKHCTPGAPDSYADRLWEALEEQPQPVPRPYPGTPGYGEQHSQAREDRQQRQAREIHGVYGRTLEDPGEPGGLQGPPP